MKTEQKMRDYSLRLISILVWFEVLWATVFIIGVVFQWSGLTDQLSAAFFGSGFCAVLVLAALAVLNITANLNIMSKAQVSRLSGQEIVESKPGSLIKTLAIAGALIALVVLSLWFAEWRLFKNKENEAMAQLESIAESTLTKEAIQLIKSNAQVAELAKVRDALSANIQSGARLSLIFPVTVKGIPLYHEFTAWWYGGKDSEKTIEDAGLPKYVVRPEERSKYDKMLQGELQTFSIPRGANLRAFRIVKTEDGEIILLIDTSRRSEYSRGSF